MKILALSIIALSALSLAGCQTVKGIQKDFSNLQSSIGAPKSAAAADTAKSNSIGAAIINDGTCPPIIIDPQLDSMTEFYDMEKTEPENEVSHISLSGAQSACKREGEFLDVRIDLTFDGDLGPKARRRDNDRPSFGYPYFVTVSDEKGEELAKEIFSASLSYEARQNEIQLVETIRQRLPLHNDGSLPPYQIHIGFQISEDQLFFNASK